MANTSSVKTKFTTSAVALFVIALLAVGSQLTKPKSEATVPLQAMASSSNTSSSGSYKDGTYVADGMYGSPGGQQSISVGLTLANNVVTDASVQGKAKDGVAQIYQSYFVKDFKTQVVGKKIDSLHLSRVSGSSLTSQGFNNALEKIKQQAKA